MNGRKTPFEILSLTLALNQIPPSPRAPFFEEASEDDQVADIGLASVDFTNDPVSQDGLLEQGDETDISPSPLPLTLVIGQRVRYVDREANRSREGFAAKISQIETALFSAVRNLDALRGLRRVFPQVANAASTQPKLTSATSISRILKVMSGAAASAMAGITPTPRSKPLLQKSVDNAADTIPNSRIASDHIGTRSIDISLAESSLEDPPKDETEQAIPYGLYMAEDQYVDASSQPHIRAEELSHSNESHHIPPQKKEPDAPIKVKRNLEALKSATQVRKRKDNDRGR